MSQTTPPHVDPNMSFDVALQELEALVRQIEEGKLALEDAILAYQRGVALKKHCDEKLHNAKTIVEKISVQEQQVHIVPFEEKI